MTIKHEYCNSCGGTGEKYIGALAGDGWRGGDCDLCNGYGDYVLIDGDHYVREWFNGPLLRGPDGRFRSCPELVLDDDQNL